MWGLHEGICLVGDNIWGLHARHLLKRFIGIVRVEGFGLKSLRMMEPLFQLEFYENGCK